MTWRSVHDATCRRILLDRIGRLTADAPRRWGRMTAPQMVAHLSDQMRHTLGDAPVRPRRGILRWSVVRYASIYLVPWPKGRVKGPSEAFLTLPGAWESDVRGLVTLVERFVAFEPGRPWPDHALFGPMSGADWGVFIHKHFDHHLRQFGV